MDDATVIWAALRGVFEDKVAADELLGATIVVMLRSGEKVTMKTFMFPQKEQS